MIDAAEGWILAGGRSSRMGADKATLHLAGARLLDRMLDKVRRAGLSARVAGVPASALSAVREPVVADRHRERGPLAGLESALRESRAPLALVVAVDLPLLEVGFLKAMVERALRSGASATIPRVGGVPQPLCAVYSRELAPRVSAALERESWKVLAAVTNGGDGDDLFDAERVFAAGAWESRLPVHLQFLNCNRPSDAAAAALLAAGQGGAEEPSADDTPGYGGRETPIL